MRVVKGPTTLRDRRCPVCGAPVRKSHRCRTRLVPPPAGWRTHLALLPDLDVDVTHVDGQLTLPIYLPPTPHPQQTGHTA